MKMNRLPAQKNKPNSNPIQTQSKPVLSAVEWANFFKGQNELKIACWKIWPHPKKLRFRIKLDLSINDI